MHLRHNLLIEGKQGRNFMEKVDGILLIAASCGIVVLIALLRSRAQLVLNVIVRAGMGAVLILFMKQFLEKQGVALCVGINAVSLLTSGMLGFPGVALLYAITATNFL